MNAKLDLQRAFREHNLDVKDVGAALGKTVQTVYSYITGSPSVTTLQSISEVLNIDIRDFFYSPDDDQAEVGTTLEKKLKKEVAQLKESLAQREAELEAEKNKPQRFVCSQCGYRTVIFPPDPADHFEWPETFDDSAPVTKSS